LKNFPALVTLYSAAFVAGCSLSWLFPVVPLYAAELGAPVSQVGLIVAAFSYVTAFLLIPLGMLSDRLGLHKFVVGGLAIFALAPLLYPLAINPQHERTGTSSWGWMKQALAFAALLMPLFIAIGAGTLGTYIPLYGQGFGITAAGAGAIITASYASSALLRAPAGRLSDRVGRKPMIVCGMAVTAVAAGFISVFHSLSPLIIVAIFFGIGMGLAMPAGLALVADLSSAGQRGLAMAMPTCFFQIGLAVGTTAMGFVAEASGFEMMFLACASSLAFGLFIIWGLMRAR